MKKRALSILLLGLAILFILNYNLDTKNLRNRVEDHAYEIIEDKGYRSWTDKTQVKEIFPVKNALGNTQYYLINLETEGEINGSIYVKVFFKNLISKHTAEEESIYTRAFPQIRDGEAELKTHIFSKGVGFTVKYQGNEYYTYDMATFHKK